MYTVVTERKVYRINAKSLAHATQALKAAGIEYLAIEADA